MTVDRLRHFVDYRVNYQQAKYFAAVAFLIVAAIPTNLPDLPWLILVLPFLCVGLILIGMRIGLLRLQSFLRRSLASGPKPVVTV